MVAPHLCGVNGGLVWSVNDTCVAQTGHKCGANAMLVLLRICAKQGYIGGYKSCFFLGV